MPTARPTVRGDRVPRDELAPASDAALRMLDTWGWLLTMADDLAGIGRALTRPPPPGAETCARENGTKDGGG